MNTEAMRKDFPLFQKHPGLIYFDNACMSLRPKQVINEITRYYSELSSCAGRSAHRLAHETEDAYEGAREKVANFIGAKTEEAVFTRNTTEAINLVAGTFDFSQRKKVVTSVMEHHSAILPFQRLAQQGKISLEFVEPNHEGIFSVEQWGAHIDYNTALVITHGMNNSVGTEAPIAELAKLAHDEGAMILVDGAQTIPHKPFNFSRSGIDFLAFSGHKMLGPSGTGCLAAKSSWLESAQPFLVGGETIEQVKTDATIYAKPPKKFEAGLQYYAGAMGFGAACDYLKKIGMENIETHEKTLAKELTEAILSQGSVKLLGPRDASKRNALASFTVKGNPHEAAILLDRSANICVRSGLFCAQPAMEFLGAPDGAVRASLYFYNTEEEIEKFSEALGKVLSVIK